MLTLLTHSRIKVARACQKKHHLRYVEGLVPAVEPEHLTFGSAIHAGLEAWFRAAQAGQPAETWLAAALAALPATLEPFDRVRAEAQLTGYHVRWSPGFAETYEVIGVEVEFCAPIYNPRTGRSSRLFEVGGKIDAIVRERATGRVLLVEHKTSSEDLGDGSVYWTRLRLDGQVSVYYDGAAALGHQIEGCLYDVLRKPGLRPLKATPADQRKYTKAGTLYANQREFDETPEEFKARLFQAIGDEPDKHFRRGIVVRLERELDEARWDMWQFAQQFREAELNGFAPRNVDACQQFGQACPYLDLCSGLSSPDDTDRWRRVHNVHPELTFAAAEGAPASGAASQV